MTALRARLSPASVQQLARPFPPEVIRRMSEQEFQAAVVELAGRLGWWSYHPLRSRGSRAGWPDVSLLRGPRAVFMELKQQAGLVKREQQDVLDRMRVAGLDAHLFRPSDWPEIVHLLVKEI